MPDIIHGTIYFFSHIPLFYPYTHFTLAIANSNIVSDTTSWNEMQISGMVQSPLQQVSPHPSDTLGEGWGHEEKANSLCVLLTACLTQHSLWHLGPCFHLVHHLQPARGHPGGISVYNCTGQLVLQATWLPGKVWRFESQKRVICISD